MVLLAEPAGGLEPAPARLQDVVAWVEARLGRCRLVADRSWPHRESLVAVLETVDGQRVVAKAHRRREKFAAELDAYRRWAPALGLAAPALLAADEAGQALALSWVDGAPPAGPGLDEGAMWENAGRLLRRLHDAEAAVDLGPFGPPQLARLEAWVRRARPGLLDGHAVDFAADLLGSASATSCPGVPSHRDFQPRNWLRDRFGRLSLIDFEHAAVEPWLVDLRRLWWDEWDGHPERAAAFLDGYGRDLDAADRSMLAALSALEHLTTIVWADEHGDQAFEASARAALDRAMAGAWPAWPARTAPRPVRDASAGAGRDRFTVVDLLAEARRGLSRLGPHAARAALAAGALLVDTRQERDRQRDGAVPGSLAIPRTVLEWAVDPASGHPNPAVGGLDRHVIVMCNEGYSSSLAAANLQRLGFERATDLVGGYAAWKSAGLPVQAPRAAPGALDGRGPAEPGEP